jgi:hypothetical protein
MDKTLVLIGERIVWPGHVKRGKTRVKAGKEQRLPGAAAGSLCYDASHA